MILRLRKTKKILKIYRSDLVYFEPSFKQLTMKTITFITTESLGVILGVTFKTVTNRTRSIRLRELVLKNDPEMDSDDAEKILSELRDELLAGYNYEIQGGEGAGKKSTYVFYKIAT